MSDFDDLMRSIEEEAQAEGPEAVAELEALDRHFAALAAHRDATTGPDRTSLDELLDRYGVTREELRAYHPDAHLDQAIRDFADAEVAHPEPDRGTHGRSRRHARRAGGARMGRRAHRGGDHQADRRGRGGRAVREFDMDAINAEANKLRRIRDEHGVEIMLNVEGGMSLEDALVLGGAYLPPSEEREP